MIRFGKVSRITVSPKVLWWIRNGYQWVSHWLPNLRIGRKWISSDNARLGEKPYKLDEWEPNTPTEIGCLLVYYGFRNVDEGVIPMGWITYPRCVALFPHQQRGIYQLYPFHYYFLLPEPIPPIDFTLFTHTFRQTQNAMTLLLESWGLKPAHMQRDKRSPHYTWVMINLLTYYFFAGEDEILQDTDKSGFLQNVLEIIESYPHSFLSSLLASKLWQKGFSSSLPPELRKKLSEIYAIWSQVVDFINVGLELEEMCQESSHIWKHIFQRLGFK